MWSRPGEAVDARPKVRVTKEIRAAFRKFDLDNSGDIDYEELLLALQELGFGDGDLDMESTRQIASSFDDNNDGTMQIDEFAQLVKELEAFKKSERVSSRASYVVEDEEDWSMMENACGCWPMTSIQKWKERRATVAPEAPTPPPECARTVTPMAPPMYTSASDASIARDATAATASRVAWTSTKHAPKPGKLTRSKTSPTRARRASAQGTMLPHPPSPDPRGEHLHSPRSSAPASQPRPGLTRSMTRSLGQGASNFQKQMASGANRFSRSSGGLFRMSTATDKTGAASASARQIGSMEALSEVRDTVRNALDKVGGQSAESVSAKSVSPVLIQMLEDVSREDLVEHVSAFAESELAHSSSGAAGAGAGAEPPPPKSFSIDEFAAYFRRFEPWAEQRKLLSAAGISVGATDLELVGKSNTDRVLLAACQHCSRLRSMCVQNAKLHNSTITSLATRFRDQLNHLDLTGCRGFDDLGIKALAAYCPELEMLKVAGTPLTDDGLIAVLKNCPKIRELEVDESAKISKCLSHAHADCDVTRVPIAAKAPMVSRPEPLAEASVTSNKGRKFSLMDGLQSLGGGVVGVARVGNIVRRFSRDLGDKADGAAGGRRGSLRRGSVQSHAPQSAFATAPSPASAPSEDANAVVPLTPAAAAPALTVVDVGAA